MISKESNLAKSNSETTKSVNFRYLDKKSSKAFLHLYLLGKVSNEYIVLLIKGIIPFSFKISNKK